MTRNTYKLLHFLTKNKDRLSPLLILTHDYPDPDALASAYALQHALSHGLGIRARIAYGGVIGRMENKEMVRILRLPVHPLRATDLEKHKNVALVDTQPLFGNNSFSKQRKATIVIDQHPSAKEPLAEMAIVDTECGATSVLLAQLLFAMGVEIPARLATALVYGIISDTLNLYKVKKPEIIKVYLNLLPLCDIGALGHIQNPSRSKEFFATLANGIQKSKARRRLIVSHLGPVESPDLVSQIADFLLTCEGMHWAFCTGRYRDGLHVSLRSASQKSPAGKILRDIFRKQGQAGGHGRIAGGKLRVGKQKDAEVWEQNEHELVERLVKRLRIPAKSHYYPPFQRVRPNEKEP